ncbi:putative Acetylornithine deacetylase [Magnetospirillum sp. LM-5]|uniref:M20 family metallopeptidase n=1 Tax=Magnetospirillum sp. LM-5 TaxID=2681466 RepID=UPI001386148F|nr:M20/M25/M40 family metallo-hydrolase [Magnetospirillum sp. LM-5]CAA7618709.1 putative Acetylornithine deacetylase [Magnetospirillum sp. LM-5]
MPASFLSQRQSAAVELLRALVRCPGDGRSAMTLMEQELERLGLRVERIPGADPQAPPMAVVARLRGRSPDRHRSLALNAHTDVVPVDEPQSWRFPPYAAVEQDGWLWGRGAQDDRAGLVVMILVAEAISSLGLELGGDLVLQVVDGEETSAAGSKAVGAAGHVADGTVIIDGTWPNRIIHAHLGQAAVTVTATGTPGAAGNVARLGNPFDALVDLLVETRAFVNGRLASAPPFPGLASNSYLNIGRITGGAWCGAVPAQARAELMIGFAPPWTSAAVLAEITALAARVSPMLEVAPGAVIREPYCGDPNGELISRLKPITERVTGNETRLVSITGYSDMAFVDGGEVCLYGPGGGENAHGRDERYRLADLVPVAHSIIELAVDWCNRERGGA